MQDSTLDYFSNSEFLKKLSPEAVVVYFVLRADASQNETTTAKFMKTKNLLVSGFSVQSIARRCGLTDLTVKRCVLQLSQLGWVKELKLDGGDFVYQLGVLEDYSCQWFVDLKTPKRKRSAKSTDKIRKALAEQSRRRKQKQREKVALNKEQKKKIIQDTLGEIVRTPKYTHQLMELFKKLHLLKFKCHYRFNVGVGTAQDKRREYSKMYSYLDRYLKYCSEDFSVAKTRMEFIFENWEKIKESLDWEGSLSLNLLGTANIIKMVRFWQEAGFKKKVTSDGEKVAKRYDESLAKEAPDEGF